MAKTNRKFVVLNTLKTAQDFTELLELSELKVQMEVLGFLQENLYEYQLNYFKSHLKTFQELVDYLPEKDLPIYFPVREYDNGKYLSFSLKYAKKIYDRDKYSLILTNFSKKEFYYIGIDKIPRFKFSYKRGNLICTYFESSLNQYNAQWGRRKQYLYELTVEIKFSLRENKLISYIETQENKNEIDIGSSF